MKILMKDQKDPANLIMMLKTTISIHLHKVHNRWMHAMKVVHVLVRNRQIKVNKNWCLFFFIKYVIYLQISLD